MMVCLGEDYLYFHVIGKVILLVNYDMSAHELICVANGKRVAHIIKVASEVIHILCGLQSISNIIKYTSTRRFYIRIIISSIIYIAQMSPCLYICVYVYM